MKVIRDPAEMQAMTLDWKRGGQRIAFVPTMGFLHEGHLSLVRKARALGDICVVSIFINPTQFGVNEDLDSYPRDEAHDLACCEREGVDVVFHPDAAGMYREGHSVTVHESALTVAWCGASRPGHFEGVLTVVAKLFNIVQPDVAVFGQKDCQQARAIERLIEDLNVPVELVLAPTVREADGLAMSSRNKYLTEAARKRACCLHESLVMAMDLVESGERNAAVVTDAIRERILAAKPASVDVDVDYVAVVDWQDLRPAREIGEGCCILLAVRVGGVRLIDNMIVGRPEKI